MLSSIQKNTILKDFLSISYWQSLVAIILFYLIMIPFFILVTKYKMRFVYKVLLGLLIGLIFGVVLQSIINFPKEITKQDAKGNEVYIIQWLGQFNDWAQLFKQIFINGILLLTVPVVFIAIFRATAKSKRGATRLTGKAIFIMLFGVMVAFVITFLFGILLNVGKGQNISVKSGDQTTNYKTASLPEIAWGYIPQNFFATVAGTSIIPVIIMAAILGVSVRFVEKKHPDSMKKLVFGFDRAWDIIMSSLLLFMKIMPMAVMSMITVAATSRPIGLLANIGKVIGVGYLGLISSIIYMTIVLLLSGVSIKQWWKSAWRPLLQGFITQSSDVTLPVTMDTMKNGLKINEKVVSIVGPLSSTVGLIGGAGVQAGLVTSFLWTGSTEVQGLFDNNIYVFFIMSFVVCMVTSLGVAGIPGSAAVVTSSILGGLGLSLYFQSVYAIVGALDEIFDMGRTATNVLGGVFAGTMAAKWEGLIEQESKILSKKQLIKQIKIAKLLEVKYQLNIYKNNFFNDKLKRRKLYFKDKQEIEKIKNNVEKTQKIKQLKEKLLEDLKKMQSEKVNAINELNKNIKDIIKN